MASERTITASTTVPLPQERAFELLCDTSRYAEWVDGTLEVARTDGPATLGSTYDEVNRVAGPIKGRSRWRVAEHEPPERTLHTGEGVPLARTMSIEMAARPAGDEGSEVTLTFRYEPAFGPAGALLASLALHRQVAAGFEKSAEAFRSLAEREAQAASAQV